jgi:hypothetical protein
MSDAGLAERGHGSSCGEAIEPVDAADELRRAERVRPLVGASVARSRSLRPHDHVVDGRTAQVLNNRGMAAAWLGIRQGMGRALAVWFIAPIAAIIYHGGVLRPAGAERSRNRLRPALGSIQGPS